LTLNSIRVLPEDVVPLVNRKPPRDKLERSAIAPISLLPDATFVRYPVDRERFRSLRVVLAVTIPVAAVAAALFAFLAR